MIDAELYVQRINVEHKEDWHGWSGKIPYLKFKETWEVKIVPPFTGAMIRFWVKHGNKEVSVYLDCLDNLGFVGKPYWEVYPVDNDAARVLMENVDELFNIINSELG
jgi:hypothetical protein